MNKTAHILYVLFLMILGISSTVVIGLHGYSYYSTPMEDRPFHPQYDNLKPTGNLGHAYGIFGSLLIMFGVAMYSTRKRVRMLAGVGKIKHFLEFHIFLCLVGPILVVSHTTFKFGGLVAVSFWSMAAVVLSGIIGRYFYVQIPKGIYGNELSVSELMAENEKLSNTLRQNFGLNTAILGRIDAIAVPSKPVAQMSVVEVVNFFVFNDLTRRLRLRKIFAQVQRQAFHPQLVRRLRSLANRRIMLTRRVAFLQQFKQIFHYWHVVHLPFTVVMFVILAVHIGVAIAFGYTWMW